MGNTLTIRELREHRDRAVDQLHAYTLDAERMIQAEYDRSSRIAMLSNLAMITYRADGASAEFEELSDKIEAVCLDCKRKGGAR